MTAREIEKHVKQLTNDQDPWQHRLDNGAVLHVRLMPRRLFGVFYLVWVSTRNKHHSWSSRKLTAMTPKTAGTKARSLISRYGTSPAPWSAEEPAP